MKKYILITLCILNTLNGMEQQIIKREPREWNAEAYDEGNRLQTTTFLYFLEKNNIEITNKTILDIGCRTGTISAQLAEKATCIHGIDTNKNMIDFARNKYQHIKNLTFEHFSPEYFTSQKQYDLALASFSIPWIEDKKQALQNIHDSLEVNGELFGIFKTTDNPQPIHFALIHEMMPLIKEYLPSNAQEISNPLGSSYLSQQEYTNMLQETGFEIILNEEQSFELIMSEDELRKFQWSLFLRRPIIQELSSKDQELLFEEFMKRYLEKLPHINNEQFLNKVIINIVHARKIKK